MQFPCQVKLLCSIWNDEQTEYLVTPGDIVTATEQSKDQIYITFPHPKTNAPCGGWVWAHQAKSIMIAQAFEPTNITKLGPEETLASDPVNHPPHYTVGAIECIDAIRAALTEEEFRGYCKGNALKYIWRERHKGSTESLLKADWYLNRLVQCPPLPSPSK